MRKARKFSRDCFRRVQSHKADLATDREHQLTTARANKSTGLINGKAANWAPEVEFSPFRALSRRQMTFPVAKSAVNWLLRSRTTRIPSCLCLCRLAF